LATALIEKIHQHFPDARIDFLLRKGNENLLENNPYITNVIIWNKKHQKKRNLLRIALMVRKEKYTHVINAHRFATSGLITFLSKASYRAGFDKNPFAFCFTHKIKHLIAPPYTPNPTHEVKRNQMLIAELTDNVPAMPQLYPSVSDREHIRQYQGTPYICVAPSSVWFTKQFPAEKWIAMLNLTPAHYPVYIIGAPTDAVLADSIINKTVHKSVHNLCGKLSFLQSAALMQGAAMNYANDSAPLHFASAMNAPLTAVFCSTVPSFGFGPLRENARIVEIAENLYCRPCGLHGRKECPQGHFRCAMDITNDQLLWWTSNSI
jgi:heptosyltransferase-2